MAILQEADAVFYHPLDDPTEALKSAPWAGPGAFAAGRVSDALTGEVGDSLNSFGAEADFVGGTNGTDDISISALSLTKLVVVYADRNDLYHGKAKVGTVSGTDITFGAEMEFSGEVSKVFVAALSTTLFVVAYRDTADSIKGKAKVGTVSGLDITFGAESVFLGAPTPSEISLAALDATKFVVAYRDDADSFHGTAKVGTVTGTDIAFGAESEFLAASAIFISLAALSASAFVVAYRDGSDSFHGTAKVGTVSGTAVTFGAETEFLSAGMANDISLAALTATKFVVAYRDNADLNHGTAKVGTVSGTDITFGAETEFLSTIPGADNISASALSATSFVIAYRDINSQNSGTAKVGTVTGTDIAFGAEEDFLLGVLGVGVISAAALSASSFVAAYQAIPNLNHGTARVGTLAPAPASLSVESDIGAFGAEKEFLVAFVESIAAATLDSEKFVVAYTDADESVHGSVKVGTVTGTDITYGPPTLFMPTGAAYNLSITALSGTAFVVTYKDQADAGHGTAKVGTVTGTIVAFGPETEFYSAGAIDHSSVVTLSATKVVVAFQRSPGGQRGKAKVGTVSGLDITFGAEAEFSGGTGTGPSTRCPAAAIDSTRFVVAYSDGGNGGAKVGTVSGTDITFGAEALWFPGSAGARWTTVAVLSATSIVVAYVDGDDSSKGKAKVGTVAGTDITFGPQAVFLGSASDHPALAVLDSVRFAVMYQDGLDSNRGKARIGTLSGPAATFGAEVEFNSVGSTLTIDAVVLSASKFVVAYRDGSPELDHGTTKVGNAGAAYSSAVGATRLAFSAWVKAPA